MSIIFRTKSMKMHHHSYDYAVFHEITLNAVTVCSTSNNYAINMFWKKVLR